MLQFLEKPTTQKQKWNWKSLLENVVAKPTCKYTPIFWKQTYAKFISSFCKWDKDNIKLLDDVGTQIIGVISL